MTSSPEATAGRRAHRIAVPALFTLAVLVGVVACFAVWVNRQALNTDNWTKTSGELLANRQVDAALSVYMVNELFSSVDVEGELKSALPKEVQGLAGPATTGLRLLAERVVPSLLATSQVQEAWRRANQTAHRQLLSVLNGGGRVVSTRSGEVSLNLHEIIIQLAGQLGIQSQVAGVQEKLAGSTGTQVRSAAQQKLGIKLPQNVGQIVIMRSDQLRAAQNVATGIRGLAIVLPLLSVALFALAVWLSYGRRRVALRTTGWCIFGIGILLLFARSLAGDQIVDGLVAAPSNRPAAHAAWGIATSLLYDLALAMVAYGLVLVSAAWLAGRTRPAAFVRRGLAPALRDHRVGFYAAAGAALVLLVLWGPTPATRELLPVIGFAVLGALGIHALALQAGREFPDARSGETMTAIRSWLSAIRGHGPGVTGGGVRTGAAADGATPPAAAGAQTRLDTLERLGTLHDRGVLTDDEFAAEKRAALERVAH
jgi:Short C-terminal domain